MNKATAGWWSNTTAGMWVDHWSGFICAMGSNVSDNPVGSIIKVSHKPPLNHWYHIVCVVDGTHLKMYVNGIFKGRAAIAGLTHPRSENTVPLIIGRRHADWPPSFNGLIDEVRIYNRALSLAEVRARFEAGRAGRG
jgi:hypothetical protein